MTFNEAARAGAAASDARCLFTGIAAPSQNAQSQARRDDHSWLIGSKSKSENLVNPGSDSISPGKNLPRDRADLRCGMIEQIGVRIHDLRHSFASMGAGASLGAADHREVVGTHTTGHDSALQPSGR